MHNIKEALHSLGFSPEEASLQLERLDNLINASFLKIVSEGSDQIVTKDNYKEILENKYSEEEIQKIYTSNAREIVEGYFNAVTKGLSSERKKEFTDKILLDFK